MRSDTDPAPNRVRERLRAGQTVIGTWVTSNDPMVAEHVASMGFHFVVIDLQHTHVDWGDLPPLTMAIRLAGADPMVRIASHDYFDIDRALDLGAVGVVVPLVDNEHMAAEVAGACRFPPAGRRSYGPAPARARAAFGAPGVAAVGDVLCFVQVETAEALTNLDGIARTAGIDGIFTGPYDLALSLGVAPPGPNRSAADEERMAEIEDRIRIACAAAGIASGVVASTREEAQSFIDKGTTLVMVGSDLGFITRGASDARALLGTPTTTATHVV
jgi:4-hydroxy-2-oxoheptanedioate aldolase